MKKNIGAVHMLSIFIGVYALIVIAGWVFGVDALTRLSPNQINMKFSPAFCFLLSSFALYAIDRAMKGEKLLPQIVLPATTMFILLIMATLLFAGVFGVRTGIEDLFVHDKGSVKTVVPGMPAIPTMVNFVLFGIISLAVLFEHKWIRRIVAFGSAIIIFQGSMAVLGYLLGLPILYFKFNANFTPIALNTSIMFIILGATLFMINKQTKI